MTAGEALRNHWGHDWTDDPGTSHLSIVDAWGNAVAMTSTVESPFGAQRMVHGFVLKGRWRYLEHDWVASAGSFVYEPPGEIHTLVVGQALTGIAAYADYSE